MGTLSLKRPLSRSRLAGVGAAALAAERGEPAAAPATVEPLAPVLVEPAEVEPRAGDKETWCGRMAEDLHSMTGGETPEVFRWLVDAEAPVLPLMIGAGAALIARWPGAGRATVKAWKAWLARVCRSSRYLAALARGDSMRHDLDGRPVGPVSAKHRAMAEAMRDKGARPAGARAEGAA